MPSRRRGPRRACATWTTNSRSLPDRLASAVRRAGRGAPRREGWGALRMIERQPRTTAPRCAAAVLAQRTDRGEKDAAVERDPRAQNEGDEDLAAIGRRGERDRKCDHRWQHR